MIINNQHPRIKTEQRGRVIGLSFSVGKIINGSPADNKENDGIEIGRDVWK